MDNQEEAKKLFLKGITFYQAEDFDGAVNAFLLALELTPNRPSILTNLSSAYLKLNQYSLAAEYAEKVISKEPSNLQAIFNLGMVEKSNKNLSRAISCFQKILLTDPHHISSHIEISLIYIEQKKYEEAFNQLHQVRNIDYQNEDALVLQGFIYSKLKNFRLALDIFNEAENYHPRNIEIKKKKSLCLVDLKMIQSANEVIDQALEINSLDEEALVIKGNLLIDSKKISEGLAIFEKIQKSENLSLKLIGLVKGYTEQNNLPAIQQIEQNYSINFEGTPKIYEYLGYFYLGLGEHDKSYDYFRKSALLFSESGYLDNRDDLLLSSSRLKHDIEQLQILEDRGLIDDSTSNYKNKLNTYLQSPQENLKIHQEILSQELNKIHYFPDYPFEGEALGKNDYFGIEEHFLNSKLKLVVIDNFLSEKALLTLRKYIEEATIWKTPYSNGYVGSVMATGFCSRVLLQISMQLQKAMPRVVGPHNLKQAWGFKYDQTMKGINLHADFARVNTNFWITPDDSCLDPTSGGLVVYDVPAPDDWGFYDYNANAENIRTYLEKNHSKSVTIPYKMNRCVLFDSTYFHATDQYSFKEGYTNRRVNCTLLFGDGI